MAEPGLRLAVAQTSGALSGAAARLAQLERDAAMAAQAGADLLLFPELFATGYNIGRYDDCAEARDGTFAQSVADLARREELAIAYGYVEAEGAARFNAAAVIGPEGQVIGHHRKLVIPPGIEDGQFAAGEGARLFAFRGIRIALLICYDVEFAESARHVAAEGAELILAPTALAAQWRWVRETLIPTRAYENGVYLAYANHCGTENGMDYIGRSFIAGPDGREEADAGTGPEVIVADVDPGRVRAAQARLPYLRDRHLLRF